MTSSSAWCSGVAEVTEGLRGRHRGKFFFFFFFFFFLFCFVQRSSLLCCCFCCCLVLIEVEVLFFSYRSARFVIHFLLAKYWTFGNSHLGAPSANNTIVTFKTLWIIVLVRSVFANYSIKVRGGRDKGGGKERHASTSSPPLPAVHLRTWFSFSCRCSVCSASETF